MKVALLGLAQSGKKTFFSLLTGRGSKPLSLKEGESLEGIAPIHDPRVMALAAIFKPEKVKFAENIIVLCPDVVEGSGPPAALPSPQSLRASVAGGCSALPARSAFGPVDAGGRAGQRLWLETARRCDLLCMVVRAFSSDQVYHPAGSVNPERDRSSLESELLFADLELMEKRMDRLAKEKRAGPPAALCSALRAGQTPQQAQEEHTLAKIKAVLEKEMRWVPIILDPRELESVKSLNLLTLKPVLWAYNVDEDHLTRSSADLSSAPQDLSSAKQDLSRAQQDSPPGVFKVSCRIEQEIMALDSPDDRNAYLKELGVTASGLDRLNQAAYDAMGLMSFYTVVNDEVRAWTIRKGTVAPVAGGKVHTDIQRGFIRVEVIKYDDLIAAGSEAAAKAQGKVQVKGKDYVIQDGDICHFRFNV